MTPLCAADPELFFDDLRADEAKSVCSECPLAEQCRDEARRERIEYGVFGGEDEYERALWISLNAAPLAKLCQKELHEMTQDNMYFPPGRPNEAPSCLTCRRIASRDYQRASRARRAAA